MYRPWIRCFVRGLFFSHIKFNSTIALSILHGTKTFEQIYLGTPNFNLLWTKTPDNG